MNDANQSRDRRALGRIAALSLVVLLISFSVEAQITPAPRARTTARPAQPDPGFGFELDLDHLLESSEVIPQRVDDPVWDIRGASRDSKSFVQFRILLESGEKAVDISSSVLSISGAQFVAFRLVDPNADGRGRRREQVVRPKWVECKQCKGSGKINKSEALSNLAAQLGLGDDGESFDTTKPRSVCAGVGKVNENAKAMELAKKKLNPDLVLPADAPRLTRRFQLHPDGSVTWRLDRSIRNVEVKKTKNNLFAFKIDNNLLMELKPERPTRQRNRGGNSRENSQRRREEQAKYNEESAAFRKLQQDVRKAPESFGIQGPVEVYALYMLVGNNGRLGLNGRDPLPWTVTVEQLLGLAEMATGRAVSSSRGNNNNSPFSTRDGEDREDANNRIGRGLQGLLKTEHPYTLRLTAKALARSKLVEEALPGDGLEESMRLIIQGEDAEARNIILRRLARTLPPTTVSLRLLKEGATRMNPVTKLLTLKNAFPTDQNQASSLAMAFDKAKVLLRDKDGPPPAQVLRILSSQTGSNSEPGAHSVLQGPLPFGELTGQRRADAILAVVESAGHDELAAEWLDKQLLGPTADAALVDETLETLARVVVRPIPVEEKNEAERDFTCGEEIEVAFNQPADLSPANAIDSDVPIYIASPKHGLFTHLKSTNLKRKALAWKTLGAFTFSSSRAQAHARVLEDKWSEEKRNRPRSSDEQYQGRLSDEIDLGDRRMRSFNQRSYNRSSTPDAENAEPTDPYEVLVDAAIAQRPTQLEVIDFLRDEIGRPDSRKRSMETDAVTRSAAMLVVKADAVVGKQAAAMLQGSNLPLDRATDDMTGKQNYILVTNLYQYLAGATVPMAGLVYTEDGRSKEMNWFADSFSENGLPTETDWINEFSEPRALFRKFDDGNDQTILAASSILVKSAGGDEQAAKQFAEQVAALERRDSRSVESVWNETRKKINTQALADAAGNYHLIFNLYGEPGKLPPTEEAFDEFAEPEPRPIGGVVGPVGGLDDLKKRRPLYDRRGNVIPPAANEKPTKTITFGVIPLDVDGETIRFGKHPVNLAIASGRLGISIESPGDLKLISNKELAELPLERIKKPLVIRPEGDKGEWKGWVGLADQRLFEMVLKPVAE